MFSVILHKYLVLIFLFEIQLATVNYVLYLNNVYKNVMTMYVFKQEDSRDQIIVITS
jgi:hypothetical protein